MTFSVPKSYLEIAKKVVTSWRHANYILVAPPLTEAGHVFELLRDTQFQEENDVDPEELCIAYLQQSRYRTQKEFVQRVLAEWGQKEVPEVSEETDDMDALEVATRLIHKSGRTPIILVPQFHKTIEKLSSDLGSALRDMSMHHGLRTVIELPIPWENLCERRSNQPDKDTILCSNFGGGHLSIVLTGYKDDEMKALAEKAEIGDERLKEIVHWSGGIPALSEMMFGASTRAEKTDEPQDFLSSTMLQQMNRFLKWLDVEGADSFKTAISKVWLGEDSVDDRLAVINHVWADLLLGRDQKFRSAAVATACTRAISGPYDQTIVSIVRAVEKKDKIQVRALVKSLDKAYSVQEQLRCLLAVIPVWVNATGLSPDWKKIQSAARQEKSKLKNVSTERAILTKNVLDKWFDFSCGMIFFTKLHNEEKENGVELTDIFSGRYRGKKLDNDVAAVQIVLYRLREARALKDHTSAFKAALEIPEQILHIYCGRVLNIDIWSAPDFEEKIIEKVRGVWTQGAYRAPKSGVKMAFNDLLYIGWVSMHELDDQKRLIDNLPDIEYWSGWYSKNRSPSAHSITFVDEIQWDIFYAKCCNLAARLSQSLVDKSNNDVLPDLSALIVDLGKAEEKKGRSI